MAVKYAEVVPVAQANKDGDQEYLKKESNS